MIGNAQTTTYIYVVEVDTLGLQLVHQSQQSVHCVDKRPDLGNLRANMAVNAHHRDMRHLGSTLINLRSQIYIYTKFVLFQASRDIRVSIGIHIRIYSQRDSGNLILLSCSGV